MNIIKHNDKIVTGNGKIVIKGRVPEYGCLYNHYAIANAHGLAPEGWHIAANSEITTLITYLGGASVAGGKMKETGTTHWYSPNTGADNSSGFTALPGGVREYTGSFSSITAVSNFSSSTLYDASHHYSYVIPFSGVYISEQYALLNNGMSVRCVRDSADGWVTGQLVYDIDGNIYNTVQIGTQIWMVQNLATKHYKDGTAIPNITDNTAWANDTTGARCAYNNDENYVFL